MYDVKGKWALITGAARGIGYLTAKFMAAQAGISARSISRA